MSLVGDALRKARAEGDRRGHGTRPVPVLPLPGARPARSGMGVGLVLGVLLTLAASLGGAGLVWLAAGRGGPTLPVVAGGEPPAAGPAPAEVAPRPTPGVKQMAAVPSAAPGRSAPGPERGAPATPARPREVAGDPLPAAPPVAAPPREVAVPPARRQGTATPAAVPDVERVFVLVAELGYARLQLDFLVHKPSAPFGRVNGTDIVPGSIVDGFLVEEIGRDFVRLRDSRGPVVLRVR